MKNFFTFILSIVLISSMAACATETTTTDDISVPDNQIETSDEEKLSFDLIAGEEGEYGTYVTFNEGTDMPETIIVYHVPAATYTVTNTGEYMAQISVYSDETHITEFGWEEPAETGDVELLDAGETGTISVSEGQYIEIHEPAVFRLEMQ